MNIPNAALAYGETASLGASPVGVIVLLYDRLAHDIHAARSAMKSNDVESRTLSINHALLILQQLQGRLDFTAGAAAARQLDAFYSHVRGKLLEAQMRQSPELLLAQAHAIAQVRESWADVERNQPHLTTTVAPSAPEVAARAAHTLDSGM
jgi:flagellar biosynthetic protein FliS